jgi:hypothetical protein
MFTLKQSAIVALLITQSCSLVWIYSVESRLPDKSHTLFYSFGESKPRGYSFPSHDPDELTPLEPAVPVHPAEKVSEEQLLPGDITFDDGPEDILFGGMTASEMTPRRKK